MPHPFDKNRSLLAATELQEQLQRILITQLLWKSAGFTGGVILSPLENIYSPRSSTISNRSMNRAEIVDRISQKIIEGCTNPVELRTEIRKFKGTSPSKNYMDSIIKDAWKEIRANAGMVTTQNPELAGIDNGNSLAMLRLESLYKQLREKEDLRGCILAIKLQTELGGWLRPNLEGAIALIERYGFEVEIKSAVKDEDWYKNYNPLSRKKTIQTPNKLIAQ